MSTISLDVLAEILSRLPIKSVLVFRCVSTIWCALIDSPEFVKLHLNHSLKTDTNRMVILRETEDFEFKKHCFYCLDIDGSLNDRVVAPQQLKNPLKSSGFDTKILGSCNGVLLLSNDVDNVALWNPSTGKFKKLPVLSLGGKEDGIIRFGFGYDGVSDDYKVVRIVQCLMRDDKGRWESFSSDINVYSLKSNSWKRIVEEFPYYVHNNEEPGTYLNGALHWFASSSNINTYSGFLKKLIVAFDLATEKCRVVPCLPCTDVIFSTKLKVLGDCLCACHYYCDEIYVVNEVVLQPDLARIDIWVMKKYGAKDSWTMIKSIVPADDFIGRTVVPLAYSKNGEEILVEHDHRWFVWTSTNEDTRKIIDTQCGRFLGFLCFNSYAYLGSLVQLGSSDDTSNLKKQFSQDKGGQRKTFKKRGDDFLSKGFKLKL